MPCIIICGRKKQQTNADRIIHAWLDGVHAPKTLLITHLHGVRERERERMELLSCKSFVNPIHMKIR